MSELLPARPCECQSPTPTCILTAHRRAGAWASCRRQFEALPSAPAQGTKPTDNLLEGTEGRVWLNGKLVCASAGDEPADSTAVFEKEFGLALAQGWNPILVELQQLARAT